jgi:prepilin-type processing-associated H-X9-DG protein
MKNINFGASHRKQFGFTFIELLVVNATIAVLVCLLLPALAQTSRRALRTQCLNNLKLINLSFHLWEGDHADLYPMAVSTANGGAQENIYSAFSAAPNGYGVTNVFCVMSNELNTPKVLYCPSDLSPATGPNDTPGYGVPITGPVCSVATNWSVFGAGNLSYFVDGDASDNFPKMILTGDRNWGSTGGSAGVPATSMNMLNGGYANSVGTLVSGKFVKPGIWQWTDADIHQDSGNLGMADGSVQQSSLGSLQKAIADTLNGWPLPAGNKHIIVNMP